MPSFLQRLAATVRAPLERLSTRQRQFVTLAAILAGGVGLLWLVFAFSDRGAQRPPARAGGTPPRVTNLGVMAPGQQVNPVDQWVGTAGSKLAQYESEREDQTRQNKDRQAFEARAMQRFAELEQRLSATQGAINTPPPAPAAPSIQPAQPPANAAPTGTTPAFPAATALPPPRPYPAGVMPPGTPPLPQVVPAAPVLTRVTLARHDANDRNEAPRPVDAPSVSTFLPVSFTRGVLLGGLDAPTGGQSQSNPHPVLIRLSDNAVLPNRFRGDYRECFVIAAGYGDISSERAYLRTESLSCVRHDGSTLEVRIQGSVYGEDGKVGMRGRLVTKQGQMLANALLAGVVGGIGQGLATASSNYSTSALGTVATSSGGDALRSGVGSGVGRALDRLAQYYIKLAENTFPVIEVDAGREIDVVITRGVRIELPAATEAQANPDPRAKRAAEPDDDTY
jgi:conjugal transfer pilus assembly protein TraB